MIIDVYTRTRINASPPSLDINKRLEPEGIVILYLYMKPRSG